MLLCKNPKRVLGDVVDKVVPRVKLKDGDGDRREGMNVLEQERWMNCSEVIGSEVRLSQRKNFESRLL